MLTRLFALGLAAALAGCAGPATTEVAATATPWNGGTWNSVLGYHGPTNARDMAGGPP